MQYVVYGFCLLSHVEWTPCHGFLELLQIDSYERTCFVLQLNRLQHYLGDKGFQAHMQVVPFAVSAHFESICSSYQHLILAIE